jgi:predicted nuclease of predicted toxin-antitoxin system
MQPVALIIRCLQHDDLDQCASFAGDSTWITTTFGIPAVALRDLGLRDATDHEIFMAARRE